MEVLSTYVYKTNSYDKIIFVLDDSFLEMSQHVINLALIITVSDSYGKNSYFLH